MFIHAQAVQAAQVTVEDYAMNHVGLAPLQVLPALDPTLKDCFVPTHNGMVPQGGGSKMLKRLLKQHGLLLKKGRF